MKIKQPWDSILVVILSLPIIALLIYSSIETYNKWRIRSELMASGVPIIAQVIDKTKSQYSNKVVYTFQAIDEKGVERSFIGEVDVPRDIYDKQDVGALVKVRYLPSSPETSTVEEYLFRVPRGTTFTVCFTVLIILLPLMYWWDTRSKQRVTVTEIDLDYEIRKKLAYESLTGIHGMYTKFLIWLGAEPPELSFPDTAEGLAKQLLLAKDDKESKAIFEKMFEQDFANMPSEFGDDEWIVEEDLPQWLQDNSKEDLPK